MSDLDIMIKEFANEHGVSWIELRNEINRHIQGQIDYEKLSNIGQAVITEWEQYNLIKKGGYNAKTE